MRHTKLRKPVFKVRTKHDSVRCLGRRDQVQKISCSENEMFSLTTPFLKVIIYSGFPLESILIETHNLCLAEEIFRHNVLVPTLGFPNFHNMSDANFGLLIYGDVPLI